MEPGYKFHETNRSEQEENNFRVYNVHLTQFIAIESMGEVATRCVSQLVDEPFRDSYITWLTS